MVARSFCNAPSRILEWLEAHPDEELTNSDMQVKFDLTRQQVGHALHALRLSGDVAVVKTGAQCTYRLADPYEAAEAYQELTEWRERWLAARGLAPSPQA